MAACRDMKFNVKVMVKFELKVDTPCCVPLPHPQGS